MIRDGSSDYVVAERRAVLHGDDDDDDARATRKSASRRPRSVSYHSTPGSVCTRARVLGARARTHHTQTQRARARANGATHTQPRTHVSHLGNCVQQAKPHALYIYFVRRRYCTLLRCATDKNRKPNNESTVRSDMTDNRVIIYALALRISSGSVRGKCTIRRNRAV